MPPAHDEVAHPSHYAGDARCPRCQAPVECITVVHGMPHCLASAVEYIWRAYAKHPSPVTDLRKAIQFIEFEIGFFQGGEEAAAVQAPPEQAAAQNPGAGGQDPAAAPGISAAHLVSVHAGDRQATLVAPPGTEIGELADSAAAILGLGASRPYTLMHGDGILAQAVHRQEAIEALAREDGHAGRRYTLLACA